MALNEDSTMEEVLAVQQRFRRFPPRSGGAARQGKGDGKGKGDAPSGKPSGFGQAGEIWDATDEDGSVLDATETQAELDRLQRDIIVAAMAEPAAQVTGTMTETVTPPSCGTAALGCCGCTWSGLGPLLFFDIQKFVFQSVLLHLLLGILPQRQVCMCFAAYVYNQHEHGIFI